MSENNSELGVKFIRSPCGVVRIIQMITLGVGLTCTLMTSMHMPGDAMAFYNVAAACGLVYSGLSLLLRVTEVYTTSNLSCAMCFEMLFCWLFIGVTVASASWMAQFGSSRNAKLVVASACGFVASVVYFLDFFCLVQSRRVVRRQEKDFEREHHQHQRPNLDVTKESVIF